MLRMLKSVPLILALAGFGLFAAGCGTDHSQMRFVQASPDAPGVDVAVDGKTVVTNLAFDNVSPSSGYVSVNAGSRRLEVRTTGTTTDLVNSNVSFGSHNKYTVLATGFVNPTPGTISTVVLTDDNSAPASGNFRLRVVHASPSAPANLDVFVVTPGSNITGTTPTISSLAYQQASSYQSIAAASLEVIVTPAGDTTQRLVDQTVAFTAGQVRTLVMVDILGGGSPSPNPLVLADVN